MMTQTFCATTEEMELATRILTSRGFNAEDGALKGEQAREVLNRSSLPFPTLRDIWNMSDANGSGDLTKDEIAMALRLIGWVQAGERLHDALLATAGPPPKLEGITDIPYSKPADVPQITLFPAVNEEHVQEYRGMFVKAGPVNGLISEDKVRNVYMASNLSYKNIGDIINVVARRSRHALDFAEFACGLYLIKALQSSQLHTVPSEIPSDIFEQFKETTTPRSSHSSPPLPTPRLEHHRSTSSLQLPPNHMGPSSPRAPGSQQPTPSAEPSSGSDPSRTSTPLPQYIQQDEAWDIPIHDRTNYELYFYKLDEAGIGHIDREVFKEFVSIYRVPSVDLDRIWDLTDFDSDGYMKRDEFIIALHLVKRKSSGEDIPSRLPLSLIPPSLRAPPPSPSKSTSLSPKISIKKAPPPVPPKKRDLWVRPSSSMGSPPTPSRYSMPLSPPLSPTLHRQSQHSLSSSPSMSSISEVGTQDHVSSPFEDPSENSFASNPPLRSLLPQSPPPPPPLPPVPDNSHQEAVDGFKEEIARLGRQVEILLGQLAAQNTLRDMNDTLRTENEILRTQVKDTERMMSEILAMNNESVGSQEQYIEEIGRLMSEVAAKDAQFENDERMIAVLAQDEKELREELRETKTTLDQFKAEGVELKLTIETQLAEIEELKGRVADMGKAMAEEPTTGKSGTSNKEMRVVIRDVTKENENLKGQVRDMQRSMEQMLLSTKHARYDELERENKRLKSHMGELEMEVVQLHASVGVGPTSPTGSNGNRLRKDGKTNGHPGRTHSSSESLLHAPSAAGDALAKENEKLKAQLRDGQRTFADYRGTSETKIVEMEQKLEALVKENNRLKVDAHASRRGQEDNSVPPPAYDDSFVIPGDS